MIRERKYARFGKKLRALRLERALTVRDCYKYFGVRQQTWNNWELGNSPVSRGMLLAICQYFQVPANYFSDVYTAPYVEPDSPLAKNKIGVPPQLSLDNLDKEQQEVLRKIASDMRRGKGTELYEAVSTFLDGTNEQQQELAGTQLKMIKEIRH